jgi:DNA polymerase III gamma/tau subunit
MLQQYAVHWPFLLSEGRTQMGNQQVAPQEPEDTQGQIANAANLSDPAPDTGTPAETPDSAPGNLPEGNEPSEQAATPGSAPDPEGEPKAVQELKRQRKLRQQAEEREAYWRGIAEGKQQAGQQMPAQQKIEQEGPRLEQFDTWEEYQDARTEFLWEKKQREASQANAASTYNARLKAAEEKNPGLTEKIKSTQYPSNPTIVNAIMESEQGPYIAEYLADNQHESYRLAQMPVHKALLEIGKIEGKLAANQISPPQKKFSQAPAPIKPTGSGGNTTHKPLDQMSAEEFIAYRNKQEFGG